MYTLINSSLWGVKYLDFKLIGDFKSSHPFEQQQQKDYLFI